MMMPEAIQRAFVMEIENLGAGNIVTVELDPGAAWSLQFQVQPEQPGTPISLNSLVLSDSDLSMVAGEAPVNATLIVNLIGDAVVTGRTTSNDSGCHVRAQVQAGKTTDLMGNWALSFD